MKVHEKLQALCALWILLSALMGLAEGGYHLMRPRPPLEFPGSTGPHLPAYIALHLVTMGLPGLLALFLSRRLPLRVGAALLSFAAFLPTLFVLVDHQARWRFWPELIQWNPPAHYQRAGLLAVALSLFLAICAAWILPRFLKARWSRLSRATLVLPALAALLLWIWLPSVATPSDTEAGGSDRPNVLLLTIDTLRQDAVGAYGGPPTPALDALLQTGVRVDGWSPAPWTRPAFAALFSGLGSAANGSDSERGVADDLPWWPVDLRDAGYHTAAVICNPHLERRWGFRRGFEEFEHSGELERLEPIAQSVWTRWLTRLLDEPSRRGDRMVRRAIRWLDAAPEGPWLLWVHLLDPHLPYNLRGADGELNDDAPGDWIDPLRPAMQGELFRRIFETRSGEYVTTPAARAALRQLYLREVRFADAQVAPLMEKARAVSGSRDLLWILASDHGEEFFEHDGFEHGHTLHGELLRVPLGMGGGGLPAGGQHPGMTLQDVGPTLIGLLGLSTMLPDSSTALRELDAIHRDGIVGIDRSAELLNPSESCAPPGLVADNLFYESELLRLHDGADAWLIEAEEYRRISLCDDPAELAAAAMDSLPEALKLRRVALDEWRAQVAERVERIEADAALAEKLRALGYVE